MQAKLVIAVALPADMGDESAFKLVTRKNNRHKKSAKRQRPSSNIHVKESDQLFSSEDKRKIILNVEHAR